ncbi:MAG: QcrA and Rieske domain-containing protein [Ktedonobacterales bacterium]
MGSPRDGENNCTPDGPLDLGDERLENGDLELGGGSGADADEGNAMLAAESVEQYVRLHEHIERLRADRAPLQPDTLSADEVQAYQMAAFFRAAAPDAAEPDATFVANLRKRLAQEAAGARSGDEVGTAHPIERTELPTARRRSEVTRRGLLGVGLGAAAAFIGAAAGAAVERGLEVPGIGVSTPPAVSIVPDGRGIWMAVAKVEEVPVGGVRRFATDSLVGFVRHTTEGFSALSGACTHMGCLLHWNGGARTYDCPCHGGRFAEDGTSAASSPVAYRPLPMVATKVEDGHVWVYAAQPVAAPSGTDSVPPYSGDTHAASGSSATPSTTSNWSR